MRQTREPFAVGLQRALDVHRILAETVDRGANLLLVYERSALLHRDYEPPASCRLAACIRSSPPASSGGFKHASSVCTYRCIVAEVFNTIVRRLQHPMTCTMCGRRPLARQHDVFNDVRLAIRVKQRDRGGLLRRVAIHRGYPIDAPHSRPKSRARCCRCKHLARSSSTMLVIHSCKHWQWRLTHAFACSSADRRWASPPL